MAFGRCFYFVLLTLLPHITLQGVISDLPEDQVDQVLALYHQHCTGYSSGYSSSPNNVNIICKEPREYDSPNEKKIIKIPQQYNQFKKQVIFVEVPATHFKHEIELIQNNEQKAPKIYVLPQKASHNIQVEDQRLSGGVKKPEVYFLGNNIDGGYPSGEYGPPATNTPPVTYGPPATNPPSSYGPPASSVSYGPPPTSPPSSYGPPATSPPISYGPPPTSPPSTYGPPPTKYEYITYTQTSPQTYTLPPDYSKTPDPQNTIYSTYSYSPNPPPPTTQAPQPQSTEPTLSALLKRLQLRTSRRHAPYTSNATRRPYYSAPSHHRSRFIFPSESRVIPVKALLNSSTRINSRPNGHKFSSKFNSQNFTTIPPPTQPVLIPITTQDATPTRPENKASEGLQSFDLLPATYLGYTYVVDGVNGTTYV